MEGFERYQTWMEWLKEIPALQEHMNGIIARTFILTKGNLEEVEFVTGATKTEIFQVYQWLNEKSLVNSIGAKEEANKGDEDITMTTADSKRKERTFTRVEMVEFAKKKLIESNPEIEFVGLKHNILTCKLNAKTFKVYISSSRDYEFMRKTPELNPYRVSAWNKGSSNIFSSCDYYALLVKADENTKYKTESDEKIEGLFVSQNELINWLGKKVNAPSGMINFYVHYSQVPGEGRVSIKVVDDREDPSLSLDYLYQLGWKIR